MFSAVLILILLTGLVIYALQVGVFEQRKSANEARYKQAFHVAESGLQIAKEYFTANSAFIASAEEDLVGERDGWLFAADSPWRRCSDRVVDSDTGFASERWHPCYGEPSAVGEAGIAQNTLYFINDSSVTASAETDADWRLPVDANAIIGDATQDVDVYALLCLLEIDADSNVTGCIAPSYGDPVSFDGSRYVITLLSRGGAVCADDENGNPDCEARAVVSEKIGTYVPVDNGLPGNVPLTTRSNFPPNGTAEIVTSPNAGGKGVPISAWLNGNESCPGAVVDASGGSWVTCERHEWYEMDHFPDDFACPRAQCSCDTSEKRLSYAEGGEHKVTFDIVTDPTFPCDLFEATFGVPGDSIASPPPWQWIKDQAIVIDDCGALDESSTGFYWFTGSECRINSNTVIGSAAAPIFLVSAASTTTLNGGAEIFGVLFVTDVEDPNAEFVSAGTNTIYGAAIIDGTMDKYTGTFQIVYIDSIVGLAGDLIRFGTVSGGWTDFPEIWR